MKIGGSASEEFKAPSSVRSESPWKVFSECELRPGQFYQNSSAQV